MVGPRLLVLAALVSPYRARRSPRRARTAVYGHAGRADARAPTRTGRAAAEHRDGPARPEDEDDGQPLP
ncbi:hypothetical protein SAMN05444921_10696 [Streptomyces wuyuanensis]|uniref:Uncharacterized protein n=1 Tax=Streptomyces wuyuanensis TaxID=1196353 RepID=A0A1G9S2D8_9ACTN|nr:hypothetical protein SAMN05444921_10696 [Streptomyces wuyuanensis]